MKNLFIFRAFFHAPRLKPAFSLVEMLMALLVASLLLAALAPVMTRKINENIHVDGNMNPPSANVKKEIRGKYKNSFLGVLWSFLNPLLQIKLILFYL